MRALKSFDFFQKISVDNITQPTILGSLLSLSAFFIMGFLLIREVTDLITPSIKKDTVVYHDRDQTSLLRVNLSIRFPKLPCHLISVDQEDQIGNHRLDISDTITKTRLKYNGEQVGQPIDPDQPYVQQMEQAIINSEGCLVGGYILVNKVPGNIHISHHKFGDLYTYLKFQRRDLFNKLKMSHKWNMFTFGEIEIKDKIFKRFGYSEHTSFNRAENLLDYSNISDSKSYDYFVKVIPHIFNDKIYGDTYQGYQYSMSSKSRNFDADASAFEMPTVMINYDMSPITMKITIEGRSWAHSLTHICAIVGGVFVIFSILNRILLSFCDFSTSASDRKVASS
jgi:hypothetical protein